MRIYNKVYSPEIWAQVNPQNKTLLAEPVKQIVFLSDDVVMGLYDKLTAAGKLQKAALLMLANEIDAVKAAERTAELSRLNLRLAELEAERMRWMVRLELGVETEPAQSIPLPF